MRNLFIEAIEQVPEAAPASKPPEVGHFGLRETESEAVSLVTSASSTDTLASAALAPASASRRSSRFRPLLEPSGSFYQPFPLRSA